MHTWSRILLGQMNWLQSSSNVVTHSPDVLSKAASPTSGDVKVLNKLARQLKLQPVQLQFWPLTGPFEKN